MSDGKDTSKKYSLRKSIEMDKSDMESFFHAKFQTLKEELLSDFRKIIDERVNELVNHTLQRVDEIELQIKNNTKALDQSNNKVEKLKNELENVMEDKKMLKKKLDESGSKILKMEEQVEDNMNRQLRKTLIFSNIKEEKDEQYDVRKVLSQQIAKASKGKISPEKADTFIERAHRGKAKSKSPDGIRRIHAAIND